MELASYYGVEASRWSATDLDATRYQHSVKLWVNRLRWLQVYERMHRQNVRTCRRFLDEPIASSAEHARNTAALEDCKRELMEVRLRIEWWKTQRPRVTRDPIDPCVHCASREG